jgi:hypothetical protein
MKGEADSVLKFTRIDGRGIVWRVTRPDDKGGPDIDYGRFIPAGGIDLDDEFSLFDDEDMESEFDTAYDLGCECADDLTKAEANQ